MTPWDYLDLLVSDARIKITAIWGIESNYSTAIGERSVLRATATLACVGRRQAYFKDEFLATLAILDRGDLTPDELRGWWAGAFGPTQFMPTAFKRYAVDFRRRRPARCSRLDCDLVASTANNLKLDGWHPGETWGSGGRPAQGFDYLLADGRPITLRDWASRGVARAGGKPFPRASDKAFLLLPARCARAHLPDAEQFPRHHALQSGRGFMRLRSGISPTGCAARRQFVQPWPRDQRVLTAAERYELQQLLAAQGFAIGAGRLSSIRWPPAWCRTGLRAPRCWIVCAGGVARRYTSSSRRGGCRGMTQSAASALVVLERSGRQRVDWSRFFGSTCMALGRRCSGRILLGALLLGWAEIVAALGLIAAPTYPAAAQSDARLPFRAHRMRWPSFLNNGGKSFSNFGNLGDQPRPATVVENNTKAPPPARKADSAPLTSVVVVGDSMADWLAYGLEQAAADSPDIGILRRHRSYSGLIRIDLKNDPRGEYPDWPQAAREILNADKVDFIVMMIGLNDRLPIREKPPAKPTEKDKDKDAKKDTKKNSEKSANKDAGKDAKKDTKDAKKDTKDASKNASKAADDAERDPEQQDAEKDSAVDEPPAEAPTGPPEPAVAGMVAHEFRSDKWTELYVKRIDDTIAALKAKNVPVFWVGLPPVRNPKMSADLSFLNDLYRSRAEKTGITYIDTWDGFVDESGRFVMNGPDFEGQIRRLRSPDGIHFTQAGARKLAHYVEREIQRALMTHATPLALPTTDEPAPQTPAAKPDAGAMARPLAGPVMPLTATSDADELLGAASGHQAGVDDAIAARVLVKGEAAPVPAGRADDFAWPRRGVAPLGTDPVVVTTTIPMTPMVGEQPHAVAAAPRGSGAGGIGPPRPAGLARRSRQLAQRQQQWQGRSFFPSSRPFFFPFFGR